MLELLFLCNGLPRAVHVLLGEYSLARCGCEGFRVAILPKDYLRRVYAHLYVGLGARGYDLLGACKSAHVS